MFKTYESRGSMKTPLNRHWCTFYIITVQWVHSKKYNTCWLTIINDNSNKLPVHTGADYISKSKWPYTECTINITLLYYCIKEAATCFAALWLREGTSRLKALAVGLLITDQ